MSSTTRPITSAAFSAALKALPLSSLYGKAAELRNSVMYLRSSNEQLLPLASEGDDDCVAAIAENKEVLRQMLERIQLLRQEVEGRGMPWAESEVETLAESQHKNLDGGFVYGNEPIGNRGSRNEERGDSVSDDSVFRRSQLAEEEPAHTVPELTGEAEANNEGLHL